METFKDFSPKCSNEDLYIFDGKVKFAFQTFIWEEFMELVEDLGAEVIK